MSKHSPQLPQPLPKAPNAPAVVYDKDGKAVLIVGGRDKAGERRIPFDEVTV